MGKSWKATDKWLFFKEDPGDGEDESERSGTKKRGKGKKQQKKNIKK